jgi:hypothetical protein
MGLLVIITPTALDTYLAPKLGLVHCPRLVSPDKTLVVWSEPSVDECTDLSVYRIEDSLIGIGWVRVVGGDERFYEVAVVSRDRSASVCSSISANLDTYSIITTLWTEMGGCSASMPKGVPHTTVANGSVINQICLHPGMVCRDLKELDYRQSARLSARVLYAANSSAYHSVKRLWSSITK